jgi:hypothetical protein
VARCVFLRNGDGRHGYGKDNNERATLIAISYGFLWQAIGR